MMRVTEIFYVCTTCDVHLLRRPTVLKNPSPRRSAILKDYVPLDDFQNCLVSCGAVYKKPKKAKELTFSRPY